MTCDYCLGSGKVWVAAFAGYDICPDCYGTGKPTPPPKVRALSPAELAQAKREAAAAAPIRPVRRRLTKAQRAERDFFGEVIGEE